MVNKVTLIGNLGADPELKHLDTGTPVARLSIATNERYKDKSGEWQDQTEWHNVILWRERAENAARILKKGMTIYVEGKISYRKYQDKEGADKYITDIIGNNFKVVDWKGHKPEKAQLIPSTEHPTVPTAVPLSSEEKAEAKPEGADDGLPF